MGRAAATPITFVFLIQSADDELSAQLRSWWELLLYGQSRRPALPFADRTHQRAAIGLSRCAGAPSIQHRGNCRAARSSAYNLDLAGWRCGLRFALAAA